MDKTGVQGWLYREEVEFLRILGAAARVGVVEIGSWKGYSTIQLARNARAPVYAIDPHKGTFGHRREGVKDTYDKFVQNINRYGVRNRVVPLRMTSIEARRRYNISFDVLFIDGDHTFEGTAEHYNSWGRLLPRGGFIAFHDVYNPEFDGPRIIYDSLRDEEWIKLMRCRSIGWAIKR